MKPKKNIKDSTAITKPKGKTKPENLSDEALGAVTGGISLNLAFTPEFTRNIAKAGGQPKSGS